jgi:hypothetical protein
METLRISDTTRISAAVVNDAFMMKENKPPTSLGAEKHCAYNDQFERQVAPLWISP